MSNSFMTPWTVARQAPRSMGFSRHEYSSGLPCPLPEDLPDLGIEALSLMFPSLAGCFVIKFEMLLGTLDATPKVPQYTGLTPREHRSSWHPVSITHARKAREITDRTSDRIRADQSLSRVRLLATPWTAAYQAHLSMGFSRQEYWSGVPLPSPDVVLRGTNKPTGTAFG